MLSTSYTCLIVQFPTQVASSEGSVSRTPEPRKSSVVRFAPLDDIAPMPSFESVAKHVVAEEGGTMDFAIKQPDATKGLEVPPAAPIMSKGWSALRNRGPSEVLSMDTTQDMPDARAASTTSLPSDMGGAGDDVSPWSHKSWLRRKRSTVSMATSSCDSDNDTDGFNREGWVGLGSFPGLRKLDRKKKKKKKRNSLQEDFFAVGGVARF